MTTVMRWYGRQVAGAVQAVLEERLDIAAGEVINEIGRRMREPKSGVDVPQGRKRYGEKRGRRIKGFGTRRSGPGEAPAVQSGALRNSIAKDSPGPLRRRVGTNIGAKETDAPYGLYLEVGTRKMAARPWLRVSLEAKREKIRRILTAPMREGRSRRMAAGGGG